MGVTLMRVDLACDQQFHKHLWLPSEGHRLRASRQGQWLGSESPGSGPECWHFQPLTGLIETKSMDRQEMQLLIHRFTKHHLALSKANRDTDHLSK